MTWVTKLKSMTAMVEAGDDDLAAAPEGAYAAAEAAGGHALVLATATGIDGIVQYW